MEFTTTETATESASAGFARTFIPNPAELRAAAEAARTAVPAVAKRSYSDRYDSAMDTAIDYMLSKKNMGDAMKEDAKNGKFRTTIYSFSLGVGNSDYDVAGNPVRFDGIYLRDMMTKKHAEFFAKLQKRFNSPQYHCSFYREQNGRDDNKMYHVYVSWGAGSLSPKPKTQTTYKKK